MTTDTIPEAREVLNKVVCASIDGYSIKVEAFIKQACLAYHKRKSQELQKQCEEFKIGLMNAAKDVEKAEKERDDLRTKLETLEMTAQHLSHEANVQQQRAEKAEAECVELTKDKNTLTCALEYAKADLKKAEAELNKLKSQ